MKSNAVPAFRNQPDPAPAPEALAGRFSLEEALTFARETRALVIGSGVAKRSAEVFCAQFPGKQAAVVCDDVTWSIVGAQIQQRLQEAGIAGPQPLVLSSAGLYAESKFVREVEEWLRTHAAVPVAVGSGTINDLVKLAAHRVSRPYACVATAASMDGYTAFGASITHEGAKQTFNCPAPRAVIADIAILRGAPAEMSASGYADLLAKTTAGADWILADAVGAEPLDSTAWKLVQGGLRAALADPAGIRAGNEGAVSELTEGLMLGGFAMQWHKTSRPASGAEHQFSHLWDMEHHVHNGDAPSHGFKVGLATLAVTALYEALFRLPLDCLDVAACCDAWPEMEAVETALRRDFAGDEFLGTAIEETRAKYVPREKLAEQLELLRFSWPQLRRRLQAQLPPFAEMRRNLEWVGAPTRPEEIGLDRDRLRRSFRRAYHIRRRFTVLDLAVRAQLLDRCLDELFAVGGLLAGVPDTSR